MPRRKLSEYRSKFIVTSALDIPYVGWSSDQAPVGTVANEKYVVKVDQAIKGRFKKGLVLLDLAKKEVPAAIDSLKKMGYSSILVEPFVEHKDTQERYISISLERDGYWLSYSELGGVDIESNPQSITRIALTDNFDYEALAPKLALTTSQLKALVDTVKTNHFSFLEINPYSIVDGKLRILDCAVEVDDAGLYSVKDWDESDIRTSRTEKITNEEEVVRLLDRNSPASFNLSVLNPQGSVFLLLSGGGASVVIADEIYNNGLGEQLANYGEYSGNPNTDETYMYTKQVLSLMGKSKAKRKILFIGGAAANFTDIANTFNGVIRAIDENADMLRQHNVKVFVRRGGPRQEIGLAKMKDALESHRILGGVYSPSTSITEALKIALQELKHD